jgi:hypothetical protein
MFFDTLWNRLSRASTNKRWIRIAFVFLVGVAVLGAAGLGGEDTQPVRIEPDTTVEPETTVPTSTSDAGTGGGDNETESDQNESVETPTAASTDTTSSEATATITDGQAVVRIQRSQMNGTVKNVLPGDAGSVTLNVTDEGNASGRLRVTTTNVSSDENGRTEPELRVDDSGGDPGTGNGELSSNLLVRWVVIGPTTGERVALTESQRRDYVTIGSLNSQTLEAEAASVPENGTVTTRFEWKVPETTGNEIQSDSVALDVEFALVS